jgi:ParB family chromosome partitioning protein
MTVSVESGAALKAGGEKLSGEDKGAAAPRRALGRGLDSLLPGGPRPVLNRGTAAPAGPGAAENVVIGDLQAQAAARKPGQEILQIALDKIDTNPYQTRFITEEGRESPPGDRSLDDLADSIRANGVIQPITVRPGKDGRFVLITGERRWRASGLAGKSTVPAIVRHVSDQQAAEITIVENLQRDDLTCIEQAQAFAQLSQEFGLTQEQIGKQVGLSRETVSNYMRLLKLPDSVQEYLGTGELGFSEARVLLTLLNPSLIGKVAEEAVRKHLSVVQLEDAVGAINMPLRKEGGQQGSGARWVDPNVRAAQRELEERLGVRVRIRDRKGKGKIVIEYASIDDFDRVIEMLSKK